MIALSPGAVRSVKETLNSQFVENCKGVIQRLSLQEHKMVWNRTTHLWCVSSGLYTTSLGLFWGLGLGLLSLASWGLDAELPLYEQHCCVHCALPLEPRRQPLQHRILGQLLTTEPIF